jgi:Uma2 family endonuclease
MSSAPRVIHRHEVVPDLDGWVLTEELVPESVPHEYLTQWLKELLLAWAERCGRSVLVARNLAVRWDEQHPRIGIDPDVAVVEPPPPGARDLHSLRLWKPGHVAPLLAVEVVSENHPYKDYVIAPEKYAACGVGELWVLDPMMVGPRAHGGPHRIQVWRWLDEDRLAQVYAGEGPAWSEVVQAWVHAVDGGRSFAICNDEAGTQRWLTPYEIERAAKEAERAAKEAERAAKEAALRELAELKAQLGRGP